jgi:endonuclease-8
VPEGDTIWRLARRQASLVGRTIEHCELRVPRYATVDLAGTTITRVWAVGKHLLWQCDDLVLQTHLRMDGTWRVHPVGSRWTLPAHTARVVVRVSGGIELVGHDLGMVEVWPVGEMEAHIGYLGPDLLAADWATGGRDEAVQRVAADPHRTIGEALLDQRNLAGIGNEYRAEVCFLRGVHPATPVGRTDAAAAVDLAAKLMRDNLQRPARTFTGDSRPGHHTYVFGRKGRPCRRCSTTIRSGELGTDGQERIIWWCPVCQPTAIDEQ